MVRFMTILVDNEGGHYGHHRNRHRRIAGSQLVIIEDASHLCFAEQPGEFNQTINSFLDRTGPGTSP